MEKDDGERHVTRREQLEELEDRADVDAVREVDEVGPNVSWEQLKAELSLGNFSAADRLSRDEVHLRRPASREKEE